jgi:hypothetical protein
LPRPVQTTGPVCRGDALRRPGATASPAGRARQRLAPTSAPRRLRRLPDLLRPVQSLVFGPDPGTSLIGRAGFEWLRTPLMDAEPLAVLALEYGPVAGTGRSWSSYTGSLLVGARHCLALSLMRCCCNGRRSASSLQTDTPARCAACVLAPGLRQLSVPSGTRRWQSISMRPLHRSYRAHLDPRPFREHKTNARSGTQRWSL